MPPTNPASNNQNAILPRHANASTPHNTGISQPSPKIVEDTLEPSISEMRRNKFGSPIDFLSQHFSLLGVIIETEINKHKRANQQGVLMLPSSAAHLSTARETTLSADHEIDTTSAEIIESPSAIISQSSRPTTTNHPVFPPGLDFIPRFLLSTQIAWNTAQKISDEAFAPLLNLMTNHASKAKEAPQLLTQESALESPLPNTSDVTTEDLILNPEEKTPLLSTTERLLNLVQYDGQTETLSFKKPIIIENTKEIATEKPTPSLINQPIPPQSPKTYRERIIQITYSLFSFFVSAIKVLFKKKEINETGISVSADVYNDTQQLLDNQINKAKKNIQEVCGAAKNTNNNERENILTFANHCIEELGILQRETNAIINKYKTKSIPITKFNEKATKQSDIKEKQCKRKELEEKNEYACYKEIKQQLEIRLGVIQQIIASLPDNFQPDISAAIRNLREYHADLQQKCDPNQNNKPLDQIMHFITNATFDLDENQQKYIHKINMQDLFKELDFINTIEMQECIIDERHDTKNGLREYSIKAKPGQPILVNINPILFNQQCLGLAEDNSGAQSLVDWGIGYAVKNNIVKPDIEINALKIIVEHGYVKTIELDYAAEVSVFGLTHKHSDKHTIEC
jgi:hypothetical protein